MAKKIANKIKAKVTWRLGVEQKRQMVKVELILTPKETARW